MQSDQQRHELERLMAMGRSPSENPSARLALTARMIDPAAWSEHAQEHVDWCARNGLLRSTSHFGGIFMMRRHLALLQAEDLLKALDRQAAGLPDLPRLDAHALSKRLGERMWKLHYADPRRHVSKKAADAVFFMKKIDGVPAPHAEMDDDGAVTLTWTEGERIVRIDIDRAGAMVLTASLPGAAPLPISFLSWTGHDPKTVAAAIEWVHFDGPPPPMPVEGGAGETLTQAA